MLWIDLESGTYGDAKTIVLVDERRISHLSLDTMSDSEIIEVGEQYGKHAITVWAVGHNQPGYMPESEPATFSSWEDARDYFVEMIKEYADSDDELDQGLSDATDDEVATMRAEFDSWLRDDFRPAENEEIEVTLRQNDGWPIAFWLNRAE